jgi:hypothetical protein
MPPPHAVVFYSGQELLAEPMCDTEAVEPVDQLIVRVNDGNVHYIRLFPNMIPSSLKKKFNALGLRGQEVGLAFNWAEQHEQTYCRLIKETFGLQVTTTLGIPDGVHQTRVRFTFKVDTHYFRAVAKIALHYYLLNTPWAFGNEPGFHAIKRFIRWGDGTAEDFFVQDRVFVLPEEVFFRGVTSSRWMHLVGACDFNSEALASVRLFYGPRARGAEYRIRLGRLTTRLILPDSAWAHAYVYDSPLPDSGPVGQRERVSLTRL